MTFPHRRGGFFLKGAGKIGLPLLGVFLFLSTAGLTPLFPCLAETAGSLYAQSEQSQYQSAYNLYLQAAALPANSPQKTQSWNNVIDAFEDFVKRYPRSAKRNDAELFLGYAYLMRSGYVDAADGAKGRDHLNYVIQQGKRGRNEDVYRKALLQYAYSYFSLMDFRSAIPSLEKFIAEFPNSEDLQYAYYYAGVSEANVGHYAKAQEYFQTCLNKFPNGARRDVCLIEQAAADGRAGNYSRADQEFSRLSMDSSYPYAKRAAIQRAYLKVLQEDYEGAIRLMDQFIRTYENDSANSALIQEALGYEAYCYLRLNRYEDGLRAIAQIEQRNASLSPQVAYLKIQLLTKLGRFDEANAILRQIQYSVLSLANSDTIPYYDSTIKLGAGDYDNTIREVLSFADITPSTANPNQYEIHYFDANRGRSTGKLTPQDYVGACGNLILAYASRYGKTRNPQDDSNQQAVFQALYRYASSQSDPVLMKIVERIDRDRQDAVSNPIGAAFASAAPAAPAQVAGNVPALNQNPRQTPNAPANTYVGSGGGAYPNSPNLPPANLSANPPAAPGNQLAPSSGQVAQNPPQSGQSAPAGQPAPAGQNASAAPQTAASAQENQADGEKKAAPKLTEDEAKTMFKKATALYEGNHLDDANNELLNLMTSSETLWTDYPRLAAAAALLRANILFELKEYDEGQTVCDMLIKMAPNSPEAVDACYFCGYRADYYGRNAKAIEYLQNAVNSPHDGHFITECYYLLAWNEWERKNTDLAEKYFSKIFRDYPTSPFWSNAAWAYAEIKYNDREYVAAEKIVNEALAAGADEAIIDRLLLLKGELALKSRDFVKARTAYLTIIREYPQSSCRRTALNRMQNIQELSEDYSDAADGSAEASG
ncbi:MAG: tetratricopeptide repeat protein [Thermoguttaceae bacterium]|nr:tetratricopeptide repeat protein [Thermoguttaceae bacterium]